MEKTFKLILDKLNLIESRIGTLETGKSVDVKPPTVSEPTNERDALFGKAMALMSEHEEIPSSLLQKKLSIDENRANRILDQLEEAGYGSCYMGEA